MFSLLKSSKKPKEDVELDEPIRAQTARVVQITEPAPEEPLPKIKIKAKPLEDAPVQSLTEVSHLNWLNQTHDYMTTRSKPWRRLRAKALSALMTDIIPKYRYDVSCLSPEEQQHVFLELQTILKSDVIWDAAKWDSEIVLERYMYRQFNSTEKSAAISMDSLEQERQKALCILLRRRPSTWHELSRYNGQLYSGELRAIAWEVSLSHPSSRLGYEAFLHSSPNLTIFRTSIYDICAQFVQDCPALSSIGLRYSFLQQMETLLQFVLYRDLQDQGLPTSNVLILYATLSNRQRLFVALSVLVITVLNSQLNSPETSKESGGSKYQRDQMVKMGVEMVHSISLILPSIWISDPQRFYYQLGTEVEHVLFDVNPSLYATLRSIFAREQDPEDPDWTSINDVAQLVCGTYLVGTCSVEASLFLYDQILFCSKESVQSQANLSTLSWIALGITSLLCCLEDLILSLADSDPMELRKKLEARLSHVPAKDLQLMMRTIVLPKSGLGGPLNELADPVFAMRHRLANTTSFQKIWDDEFTSVSEMDLIQKETNVQQKILEWDQRRLEKARARRLALIKRWKRTVRSLIIWLRYFSVVQLRTDRKRDLHARENAKKVEERTLEIIAQQQAQQRLTEQAKTLAAQAALQKKADEELQLFKEEQKKIQTKIVQEEVVKDSVVFAGEPVKGHEEDSLTQFGHFLLNAIDSVQELLTGTVTKEDIQSSLANSKVYTESFLALQRQTFGRKITPKIWDSLDPKEQADFYETLDKMRKQKSQVTSKKDAKEAKESKESKETEVPIKKSKDKKMVVTGMGELIELLSTATLTLFQGTIRPEDINACLEMEKSHNGIE